LIAVASWLPLSINDHTSTIDNDSTIKAMRPIPGTRLAHYEIVETIGKGGMGEVYRARDTRLPRDTAIKVSAERFTERFAREAHVIASLNHPNITTLYDVGPDYLVMELVEGPTLADRIRQGVLPLDEASAIARQIADALEYAHERGVVHRDLKPGNVKIRPDGVVKVLDFGLAKTGVTQSAPQSDESPTMSLHQTEAGVVLGTAAYMAPEQAKGKDVDKRADIWAFGCVFYEMLTGAPPHQGDSSQETLASILRDAPDLDKVPAQARRLLKRCLEKDPQKRLRHIGDVMSLLDEPPSAPYASAVTPSTAGGTTGSHSKWVWPVAVAAAIAIVIVGAAIAVWAPWRSQATTLQAIRFPVAETDSMKFFYGGAMAVSPDGRWMVFPAVGKDGVARYWVRSLETVEARALPGTESAFVPAAWSADSRYVIFSPLNVSEIKRIDIQGGPPQTLARMEGRLNGAAMNANGAILFGSSNARQPLFRVPAGGGTPVAITTLAEGEAGHKFPQFLPDGRHFLYLRASGDPAQMGVFVGDIDAAPREQSRQRLLATNRQAYFSASSGGGPGHLIFLRESTLMAQPFDPDRMELSGEAVPIAENVESFPNQFYGLFSVSDNGTLVYRESAGQTLALTWFDQNGNPAGVLGEPGNYANPTVSPDSTRVAVALGAAGTRDIWIIDIARGATTRFTFDPADDDNAVWSPDGKDVVFSSDRSGQPKIYIKRADGAGEERLLSDQPGTPTSWSRDGRFLLFTSSAPKTGADIWAMPDPRASTDAKPFPVLQTQFQESLAQFSPDGRWIAYMSSESSPADIYVRAFSPDDASGAGGAKWLVSRVGGINGLPRWQPDGRRLFYASATTFDLLAVDIDTSKGFQAGAPRRLFAAPPPLITVGMDTAQDGKRFLFVTTPDGGRTTPFTVVLNWAAALKR
jgi:Tol biopolymer transport system component/tRNA A-37 threonylcarbamoyl transferase component Bud32